MLWSLNQCIMAEFFLFLKVTPSHKRKVSEPSLPFPGNRSVSTRSPLSFVSTCKSAAAFRAKIHLKWTLKLKCELWSLAELEMKRKNDKISWADALNLRCLRAACSWSTDRGWDGLHCLPNCWGSPGTSAAAGTSWELSKNTSQWSLEIETNYFLPEPACIKLCFFLQTSTVCGFLIST